jgi:spermidine/putrescine-binding protein
MKRRTLIQGALGVGATLGTIDMPFLQKARAQLSVDPKQMTKTPRFSSYGGAWQATLTKAAIEPFEAKYGVKVLQETHGNEEQLIAKMKAVALVPSMSRR